MEKQDVLNSGWGRRDGKAQPPAPFWKAQLARFDAFPKFETHVTETSNTGGFLSLCVYGLIVYLVYMEFLNYSTVSEEFEFSVDGGSAAQPQFPTGSYIEEQLYSGPPSGHAASVEELEQDRAFQIQVHGNDQKSMEEVESSKSQHLFLNVDLLVLTPCDFCSITLADAAGKIIQLRHNLTLEKVDIKKGNDIVSDRDFKVKFRHEIDKDDGSEDQVGVREVIKNALKQAKKISQDSVPNVAQSFAANVSSKTQSTVNACKITGRINLNKVAGSLQITGQGQSFAGGPYVPPTLLNFSHHIYSLAFGPNLKHTNLQQPLVGAHEITQQPNTMYQYFVSVVPTTLVDEYEGIAVRTSQYAAKMHARPVMSGAPDSHGTPGIFFKYDFESVQVKISARSVRFAEMFVRVCSISGGVFVVFGMLLSLYHGSFKCSKYRAPNELDSPVLSPSSSPKKERGNLFVQICKSPEFSRSLDQISTLDTNFPDSLPGPAYNVHRSPEQHSTTSFSSPSQKPMALGFDRNDGALTSSSESESTPIYTAAQGLYRPSN